MGAVGGGAKGETRRDELYIRFAHRWGCCCLGLGITQVDKHDHIHMTSIRCYRTSIRCYRDSSPFRYAYSKIVSELFPLRTAKQSSTVSVERVQVRV